ncbi:DUF802 domain-containing protein [Pigmentiphaga litoralis]|uniref:DUF802 domain-containing protein n=1 Tax=Pigmentiphaga litoralis TaxID=516702 RepID=A0A7Y9IYZ0_9BURK|nr:DUF802 domain-containing protein [Pigmentiphaga litoralis]NYE26479.1 hypothetical protein [Pigmentiphaga litoralis]NYE85599.1 hypothetical protein [Pigmentiphaga litoralis]
MTRFIPYVVFVVGLAVAGWIGAGYLTANPLALAVTLLIVAVYLLGALELYRYQMATGTLTRAIAGLKEAPGRLGDWIDTVHPTLRNAVRLRVEGERTGLPAPTLTPYLVGLLVLLGMLGTFLGMVATLRGTGLALESSTDLEAIRASLAEPVKGLGFAFGTSVAGVATSAMLGLIAALCRRERIQAARSLDGLLAGSLRAFSLTHRREESFKLLQRQADLMPTVVDRLEAMMTTITQQTQALNDRLVAQQDVFHGKADAAYTRLAASVEQSLKDSVVEGVRSAGAAIQPAVEATMASVARETAVLHESVTQAVQRQLDGLSTRFETSTATVADIWKGAVAEQRQASEALTADLRQSLDAFAGTFDTRSSRLLDEVAARMDGVADTVAAKWETALAHQSVASKKLAEDNQLALTAASAGFAQQAASLVSTLSTSHDQLRTELATQDAQRLSAWTGALDQLAGSLRDEWKDVGAASAGHQQQICDALAETARTIAAQTQTHATATLAEIDRLVQAAADAPKAALALQSELAEQDAQRLTAWTTSLAEMAATLRAEWQQAGSVTATRQQDIVDALAAAARDMTQEARAHSQTTLAEIERLVQVAAAAPNAAAALQADLAAQDQQRLAAWTASLAAMATGLREEWQQAGASSASRQQDVCDVLALTAREIAEQTQAHTATTLAEITRLVDVAADAPKAAAALQAELAAQDQQRLAAWTESLADMAATLREEWQQAGTHTTDRQQAMYDAIATTAREMAEQTQAHASKTLAEINRLVDVAAAAPQAAAALQSELAAQDQQRLAAWTASLAEMAATLREEWQQAGTHTTTRQQAMYDAIAQTTRDMTDQAKTHASTTLAEIDRLVQVAADAPKAAAALQAELAAQDQQRLSAWTASLAAMATTLRDEWEQAGTHTTDRQQAMYDAITTTAREMAEQTQAHATTTLAEIDRLVQVAAEAPKAAAALQAELAGQDQQRLAAWTGSLTDMVTTLRQEWAQAGDQVTRQQRDICDALAQTARDITADTKAHASETIAEMARLVQAASEAPKAAADVITEVRQKLSDSMARDNVMLEERSRLLETLGTLLDAVNHASTEQRTAVDALVTTSSDMLERVGSRFTEQVESETGKLTEVAAQVTGSALEVASLGEAFGTAVQLFSQSNESLVGNLQRLEAALEKTTTRSDEQLAYYVAQAREVIDLSMLAQKQIVDDLQQLAGQRAGAAAT